MTSDSGATAPATVEFLDLPFDALRLDAAAATVMRLADGERFTYVVTPNVDHLVMLRRSGPVARAFAEAYRHAALVLCDSRILARLARLSGRRLPVVAGSDLTAALFREQRLASRSVAIIGGDAGLMARLAALHPEPRYRQHQPPMGVLGDADAMAGIAAFVEATRADVVLFAIGAPQSEIAALRCSRTGARGVGLCVGASLEFITADKRRAPRWVQRLGMEWAFRLLSEPRRLWRRYLVEGPRIATIWWHWRRGRRRRSG